MREYLLQYIQVLTKIKNPTMNNNLAGSFKSNWQFANAKDICVKTYALQVNSQVAYLAKHLDYSSVAMISYFKFHFFTHLLIFWHN